MYCKFVKKYELILIFFVNILFFHAEQQHY